jgi:hypothetical protein
MSSRRSSLAALTSSPASTSGVVAAAVASVVLVAVAAVAVKRRIRGAAARPSDNAVEVRESEEEFDEPTHYYPTNRVVVNPAYDIVK